MYKTYFLLAISYCSLAYAGTGSIEAGKKIVLEGNNKEALACMGCHMENGEGMQDSGFPQLAGMNPTYMTKQLKDLQGPLRKSDVMNPMAKSLSEQDIQDVVAYFSSLPSVSKVEKSTTPANFELGRQIAERGLWNKGVPACFTCHGPNAMGVGENFPSLMNQGKIYITQELNNWKKGLRKNDPNMLMKTIAKKLTAKEIEAGAEYLSTLTIVKTAEVK